MQGEFVTVYDQAGRLLAVLENASDVSYVLTHNDLWTASFSLPVDDPQNAHCQAHNLVRLPDGSRDTGLYRIVGMPTCQLEAGGTCTYSLEHVMATLLDDVLFGYHEIGGEGISTRAAAEYILSKQTVKRWRLGACDFADEYAYKFENTALLSSLLSLANVLTEEYTWEFDTSSGSGTEADPWIVSLRRADGAPGCGIHYMRNMAGIEKTMDASTLVTRLYLLGYGEGVNQLTIKDVNGGVPYVEADTVSKWGVKCSVYADTRIEDAALLKARGLAVLEKYKNPYVTYTASAIDLARMTGHSWDSYMPGKLVTVMDSEHGVDLRARIVSVSKSDVGGRPGEIDVTIANAERDAADSMNALADRMGIAELYSQGATNLYAQQYADNADAEHPAVMRVYIPSGCVRINRMLLSWSTAPFRAYETGAAAGGGRHATSSAGGADVRTSRAGGEYAATVEARVVTTEASTGGPISGHDGDTSGKTSFALSSTGASMNATADAEPSIGSAGAHTHVGGLHSHIFGHYHAVTSGSARTGNAIYANGNSHTSTEDGGAVASGGAGSHTHAMGAHSHGMAHYHSFSHSHSVTAVVTVPSQKITIPGHSHVVEIAAHTHRVELEPHEHDIVYGIYEGRSASGVTLYVDDAEVPAEAVKAREMDIAPYLAADEDGRITRGAWHEVKIVPTGLTRIEANLFVQTFIQSVGGGDY